MARPTRGGSSRRTTGSGARTGTRSGTRSTGTRRTTTTARTPTRATTTRGRAAKKGNPTLLVGGAIVGGVAVLALLAVIAKGGGAKAENEDESSSNTSKVSLADLAPKETAPAKTYKPPVERKPIAKRAALPKPKHPKSYYLAMCDESLWNQAKDKAKDAQKLLADVRKGDLHGMSDKAAKDKVKAGLAEALELANEFLGPVEGKYRAEAGHFLKPYDDIMMSWQRSMRSVVYGRDK